MTTPKEIISKLCRDGFGHPYDCICQRCKNGSEVFLIESDIEAIQKEAAAELSALQKENAELKQSVDSKWRELLVHREMTKGNYWAWQGSNDNLESLVCPVGIRPEQLKSIIDERDSIHTQNLELRFAISEISTHLEPLEKALIYCEQNLTVDDDDRSYWRHEIEAHEKNSKLIKQALALQPEK